MNDLKFAQEIISRANKLFDNENYAMTEYLPLNRLCGLLNILIGQSENSIIDYSTNPMSFFLTNITKEQKLWNSLSETSKKVYKNLICNSTEVKGISEQSVRDLGLDKEPKEFYLYAYYIGEYLSKEEAVVRLNHYHNEYQHQVYLYRTDDLSLVKYSFEVKI